MLTTEVYDVIDDPDVDVVIEVIGGVEQTKQYLVDALRSKKHVVTANKDLMAVYGSELLAEAKEKDAISTLKPVLPAGFRFCAR
uniref:hypothetical protein n=1 Tax=Bacillus subtilis TaxID=1423 RepID=UPI003AF93E9E